MNKHQSEASADIVGTFYNKLLALDVSPDHALELTGAWLSLLANGVVLASE